MDEQDQVVAEEKPAAAVDTSSNEVQEAAQPETKEVVETPESKQPAPEVRQPLVDEVDEMGVPLKNRLAEARRKLQQREKEIEELRLSKQQQPETPKYTAEQLRVFAASTDDQQSRMWALNELDKISKAELEATVSKKFEEVTRKTTEEQLRVRSFNGVIQRNPDLAVRDPNGNFVGFNQKNPLYQRMNFYMQDPEILNNPRGFEVAEGLAIRDLHYAQKPVVAKTIENQATQIKKLQKQTMVESGTNNTASITSPKQAALERVKQTGRVDDAAKAMGEILRAGGILSDE